MVSYRSAPILVLTNRKSECFTYLSDDPFVFISLSCLCNFYFFLVTFFLGCLIKTLSDQYLS